MFPVKSADIRYALDLRTHQRYLRPKIPILENANLLRKSVDAIEQVSRRQPANWIPQIRANNMREQSVVGFGIDANRSARIVLKRGATHQGYTVRSIRDGIGKHFQ